MSRIYLQNVLDRSDDFRATPARKVRTCSCCDETGEFDDFASVHTAHHLEAMRRHFGGDCCIDCCDSFASCDRCDAVGFAGLDIKSQVFGDERLCVECERFA